MTEGASGVAQTSWRKSSYSHGEGTDCVEVAWRKSSYSHDVGTDCVEVAWRSHQPPSTSDRILLRDSKNPSGPMLTVTTTAWQQLVVAVGA